MPPSFNRLCGLSYFLIDSTDLSYLSKTFDQSRIGSYNLTLDGSVRTTHKVSL